MSLLHATLIKYETIRLSILQQKLCIMQIWVRSNPKDRKAKLFVYTLMAFKRGRAEKWIWIRWRKQVQLNQALQHKSERKYIIIFIEQQNGRLFATLHPSTGSIAGSIYLKNPQRWEKNPFPVQVVTVSNGIFGITSTIEMYFSNTSVPDSSPSMPI